MQNILVSNDSCNQYLFSSILVFTCIFYGIQFLANNFTGNEVAISHLLYEIANTQLKDHLSCIIESSLFFNNLTDRYSLTMSTELLEKFKINVNTVQFFVLHSSVVRLVLFTINPDLSINIYAEAIIDEHTTAADLAIMKTQFNTSLSTLVSIKGAIEIKITVLISNVPNLLLRPAVFLPITDFMTIYPCSLFYHVLGYPETANYINDISNNLHIIFNHIQLLAVKWNDLLDIATSRVAIPDEDDALLLWSVIQGEILLMRYLEAVHNVYAFIQPIDNYVTFAMEGD